MVICSYSYINAYVFSRMDVFVFLWWVGFCFGSFRESWHGLVPSPSLLYLLYFYFSWLVSINNCIWKIYKQIKIYFNFWDMIGFMKLIWLSCMNATLIVTTQRSYNIIIIWLFILLLFVLLNIPKDIYNIIPTYIMLPAPHLSLYPRQMAPKLKPLWLLCVYRPTKGNGNELLWNIPHIVCRMIITKLMYMLCL